MSGFTGSSSKISEWRALSDYSPAEGEAILLCDGECIVNDKRSGIHNGRMTFYKDHELPNKATHWMPCPGLPKHEHDGEKCLKK